jgi:hypothetical protein
MPKLYTYCIPYDDGAAPNPYWGIWVSLGRAEVRYAVA